MSRYLRTIGFLAAGTLALTLAACGGTEDGPAASQADGTILDTIPSDVSPPDTAAGPEASAATTSPIETAPASTVNDTSPTTMTTAPASTAGTAAPASPALDPAALEDALIQATGCTVDEEFGRRLSLTEFMTTAIGPNSSDAPHDVIDGSFTCEVLPVGTATVVVSLLNDGVQAAEMAAWFATTEPCRPVAIVGSWMLFAAKQLGQPQAYDEFEQVIATVGGQMIATCR